MRNGWNFRNDIALVLERMVERYAAPSLEFSADSIENGNFVEAMIFLLEEKASPLLSVEEIEAFEEKADPYSGMNGHDIKPETAQELLDEFKALMRRVGR